MPDEKIPNSPIEEMPPVNLTENSDASQAVSQDPAGKKRPSKFLWGSIFALITIGVVFTAYWYFYLLTPRMTTQQAVDNKLPSEMTVLMTGGKISGIFPNSTADVYEVRVQATQFQALTKVNSDGRAEGVLAKSWSNPDNTTWLFNLNEKAKFSNGQPVLAKDVVFSITESKANEWPGSERMSLVVSAEAVSDRQVKIVTDGVNPILLNDLSTAFIINQEQYQQKKADDYAIGSGPFVIKSYTDSPDQKYVLQTNSNYYDTKSQISTLNIIATDSDDRVQYGLDNKADVILATANIPEDLTKLDQLGYEMKSTVANSVRLLGLDQNREPSPYIGGVSTNPLKKLAVRQALYKAIDLADVAKNSGNPSTSIATQFAPVSVFGHDASITTTPKFDLVAAKKLLVEAGYPNGFSLTVDVPSTSADVLTNVTKHWKEIGVTVTVNPLSQEVGLPKLSSHDTSAYFISWEFSTYDFANGFTELLDPTNPYNFTAYSNPEAAKLHTELSTTIDLNQRKTKSQELQKLLLDDVAFIPVIFEGDAYVVKKTIDFSEPSPTSWKAK